MTRWAWRLFRREWRQQVLVLAVLAVAVAVAVVGSAVATSVPRPPSATFGTASALISLPGSDPHLSADIASIRQRAGPVEVIENQRIAVPGSVATIDLRAEDPRGIFGQPRLSLLAGRYPAGPDQVAVTPEVASIFRLRIGDLWHQGGRARRVTGLIENPGNLLDEFALVAPGQVSRPGEVTILLDASLARLDALSLPAGSGIEIAQPAASSIPPAGVVALYAIGLLFVGLVAVAGFSVLARRRLTALGMLAAVGAADRHLRWVMLVSGAIVGAVAAGTGAGLGLVAWSVLAPRVTAIVEHRIDPLGLPWWAIGAAMVLAFVTSVAAAGWPAWAVTRIPIAAALSGRPPRPRPPRHFTALACFLLVAGLSFLALSYQQNELLILAGIASAAGGVLLLAPRGIVGLAAISSRAPAAIRLALRDVSSFQSRSGTAVTAISLVVGIAAAIVISSGREAAAAASASGRGNLPANQLIVYLSAGGANGPVPVTSPSRLRALRARVRNLAAVLHAQDILALDGAIPPAASHLPVTPRTPAGHGPRSEQVVHLARVTHRGRLIKEMGVVPLYIATPALLRHYRIAPGTIGPAAEIISGRTDLDGLKLTLGGICSRFTSNCGVQPKIQRVRLPAYTSDPGTLVTASARRMFKLRSIPVGWLIQAPKPLSAAQVSAARHVAVAAGVTIETRPAQTSRLGLADWATVASLLVALGVLAGTIGLIRSETADDLSTLTAAGASTRSRRTLAATTAMALALPGTLAGLVGAYVALAAWERANPDPLTYLTAGNLLVIAFGLPLIASAAGWLLGGREPQAIGRQPS